MTDDPLGHGPGVYDDIATAARSLTDAAGVVLIVLDGNRGGGMSVQVDPSTLRRLPAMLERVAAAIRADVERVGI